MSSALSEADAFARVHEFATAAREGLLNAEQLQAFDRGLQQDAELLQTYVAYLRDSIALPRRLAALEAAQTAADTAAEQEDRPHAMSTLAADAWSVLRDVATNYMALSALISGLFITTIVLSLALWKVPEWRPAALVDNVPSTEFVARISDSQQATFNETSDGNFQNRELFEDDTVVLDSGLAVIEYDTGARVVLEGPATYQIQGANGGDLRRGKLVARVDTDASHGFAVDIPSGRIVDLGTEFGAEVSADGNSRVAVLSGAVALSSKSGSKQNMRLTAGQAATVDASSGSIAVEREVAGDLLAAFRGQLKMTPTEPAAETRAGGSLVAYWPLNDGPAGSLVVTADDKIDDPRHPATDATVEGQGEMWVRDPERGIVLQTTETGNLIAGTQGIEGDFTWSLWIKTNDRANHGIMGNRQGSAPHNLLTPVLASTWGGIGSHKDLRDFGVADGRWHHMAFRRLGDEVSVWVDGEKFPETGRQSEPQNGRLRIGGDSLHAMRLKGFLSDVAIWTRALTEQEIKALAAGGPVLHDSNAQR